jgi:hypothetical protein
MYQQTLNVPEIPCALAAWASMSLPLASPMQNKFGTYKVAYANFQTGFWETIVQVYLLVFATYHIAISICDLHPLINRNKTTLCNNIHLNKNKSIVIKL